MGQKICSIVAVLNESIALKTSYQLRTIITITKTVFEHFSKHFLNKQTGQIDTKRLFQFVFTLNYPDEIFQNTDGRLHFFKMNFHNCVNQVVVDKASTFRTKSIVVTHFDNFLDKSKDKKYLYRQKNTMRLVFLRDLGRAGKFPSSDMLAQVPGIWSRLPRSSRSKARLTLDKVKVNT